MSAYSEVQDRIAAAASATGRNRGAITLIAISKTFGADDITPVLEAGQHAFGENRVQESQGKWPELKQAWPETQLHLVGQLQSNKAREAIALFDVIHSLDRPSLAKTLASEIKTQNRTPQLFIQVNTGEEPQKGGVVPAETEAFLDHCRSLGLDPAGLMCVPPENEEPALHFALLAEMAHRLGLRQLSMGMSSDFETAIALGATHIRVGSAIFGHR